MSSGYFDYRQHRMDDIIEAIEDVVENNDAVYSYNQSFINELINAIRALKIAYIYTHRIDYLLSGDDSQETFLERLRDNLNEIETED